MAAAMVTRALEIIGELNEDELRLVQRAVEERLVPRDEKAAWAAFYQALVETGLVKEVKPRRLRADVERPLVQVKGRPVSETLIEDRR